MDFFDFHHHHSGRFGIYNLDLFSNDDFKCFSVGLHPKDIDKDYPKLLDWIKEKAKDKNCLAIGECGLDALVKIDEELQQKVFKTQIQIANDIKKPVIIHCVRKHAELLRFSKYAKVPMIVHGFNKKENIAKSLLTHGFYLSFGKSLLENLSLQSVFRDCPADRFFLETDISDIGISEIFQQAALLKNIEISELQNLIQKNLNFIFKNE
ncbi:hypothetical protein G6R40_09940 [Chryseobacterium sp. POL2]|uniref:TatD family hydrolase n=1 Tax=Chryseobacterium sp. POL2 TaxID=2713414 RepID=UPI0013E1B5AC|nr:TatD family hydrolase [Chryseobacterium sp. POL2]QIG89960.1 hypothetical protein G6R40_09940 [Chryseobacterium sp. POL2]